MDDSALEELGETIATALPTAISSVSVTHNELMLTTRPGCIVEVATHLRNDQQCLFKMLVDITAVDFPERTPRFEVVYNFLSIRHNQRVRVKVPVDEDQPVPTVSEVFSTAGWFEREVWDLFGVPFSDHPDLRRIVTDYGFEGHPLRKNFPVTGFVEVRYDDEQKRVIYEPVSLAQEYRRFDFTSPWEGTDYVLPGDEKANGQE